MSEFERALQRVLAHEGGFSNNPKDPGGATMKGVTQATYDAWRKSEGLPTQSVRAISSVEISSLYRAKYWNLIKGDRLPPGVSYVVFDGAVNSGVGQSVKWLQKALQPHYTGTVDGIVGPGTIQAIAEHPDLQVLITQICVLRLNFLKSLKTWPTFGGGWEARVISVQATGVSWVVGANAPRPLTHPKGGAKALPSDRKTAPSPMRGDMAVGGGTVAATLSQSISQLMPLQAMPSVAKIITILTVLGVVVALAGVAWRIWAKHKREQLEEAGQ